MESHMDLMFPMPNPFISVALGKFSMRTGIHVDMTWRCNVLSSKQKHEDLLKIALTNVYRQPKENYKWFPCSIFHDGQFTMIYSIFLHESDGTELYYALAFFLQTDMVGFEPSRMNIVMEYLRLTSSLISRTLGNSPLYGVTPELRSTIQKCITILMNRSSPPIEISRFDGVDDTYLGVILNSHLQTHMTTIISIGEDDNPMPLFNFLTMFCLPFQRDLSCSKPQKEPTPFYYVQVVSDVPKIPIWTMVQFPRPWTWVNLTRRKVFQSPSYNKHQNYHQVAMSALLSASNRDREAVQQKCLKSYKIGVAANAKWAARILQKMRISPLRTGFCKTTFSALIDKSMMMAAALDQLDGRITRPEDIEAIETLVGAKGDIEKFRAIEGICQVFNPRTYQQLNRNVCSQMLAVV